MISFSPWIIHPYFHLLIFTPFSPPTSLLLTFLPQFFLSNFHSFSLILFSLSLSTKLKSHQYPDFVSHECVVSVTKQSSFVLQQLFPSILSSLFSLLNSFFSLFSPQFFLLPFLSSVLSLFHPFPVFLFLPYSSPSFPVEQQFNFYFWNAMITIMHLCIWYTIELENAWKEKIGFKPIKKWWSRICSKNFSTVERFFFPYMMKEYLCDLIEFDSFVHGTWLK